MAIKLFIVLLFSLAVLQTESTTLWHEWKFSPQNYPPLNWSPPVNTQFTRNVYDGSGSYDSFMPSRFNQYMWKQNDPPYTKVYCGIESYLNDQGNLCHRNPRYWKDPSITLTCVPTYNLIPCHGQNCCYPA